MMMALIRQGIQVGWRFAQQTLALYEGERSRIAESMPIALADALIKQQHSASS